jgi:hypothetical protein
MPTRILIARGSKESLDAMRVLEYGELFFEKIQLDPVQDGMLIIEPGGQVEPAPATTDK